jgi:hypothetical protein
LSLLQKLIRSIIIGRRLYPRSIFHRGASSDLKILLIEEMFERVYLAVSLQRIFAIEIFTAIVAQERSFTGVGALVRYHLTLLYESFIAHIALEGSLSGVR